MILLKWTVASVLLFALCACTHSGAQHAVVESNHLQSNDGMNVVVDNKFEYAGKGGVTFPIKTWDGRSIGYTGEVYLFVNAVSLKDVEEAVAFSFLPSKKSGFWFRSQRGEERVLGQLTYLTFTQLVEFSSNLNFMEYSVLCMEQGYSIGQGDYVMLTYKKSLGRGIRKIDFMVRLDALPPSLASWQDVENYLHKRFSEAVEIR